MIYICWNIRLSLIFSSVIQRSRVRFPSKMSFYNFCGDLSFLKEFWNQPKILYKAIYFLYTTTKLFLRPNLDEPCHVDVYLYCENFYTGMGYGNSLMKYTLYWPWFYQNQKPNVEIQSYYIFRGILLIIIFWLLWIKNCTS